MTVVSTGTGAGNHDHAAARPATRTAVTVLGLLAGAVAVEHAVGEIRQGRGAPEAVVIESWPDSPSFAALAGEPALTVLPDLVLSGVVTTTVAVGVAVHVLGLAHRRHAGAVLLGLALLLLLVGGGFGPPLLLAFLAVAWMLPVVPGRAPAGFRGRVAGGWRPLLVLTVASYLGLFPGTVLLHRFAGVDSAVLVLVLTGTAFAGLLLTLVAARAQDRRDTGVVVGAAGGVAHLPH